MLELENRTVVITGGATGIGLGLAQACGHRGARIVIGEPRQHRLDEAVAILEKDGIAARAYSLDVTVAAELEAFAEQAFEADSGMCFLGTESRVLYVNFETRCYEPLYTGSCSDTNKRKSSAKYQFDVARRIKYY